MTPRRAVPAAPDERAPPVREAGISVDAPYGGSRATHIRLGSSRHASPGPHRATPWGALHMRLTPGVETRERTNSLRKTTERVTTRRPPGTHAPNAPLPAADRTDAPSRYGLAPKKLGPRTVWDGPQNTDGTGTGAFGTVEQNVSHGQHPVIATPSYPYGGSRCITTPQKSRRGQGAPTRSNPAAPVVTTCGSMVLPWRGVDWL